MKTSGFENRLNLIVLSDAFRRHAPLPDHDLAESLVDKAREVAVLSTYYYPEYPDLPENRRVDARLRDAIQKIARLAQKMGIDHVVLPLDGDSRSWVAQRLKKSVLKDLESPVRVTLQKTVYRSDLSSFGPIDKGIKTALDKGVRGMMNIDQNLKYNWDR